MAITSPALAGSHLSSGFYSLRLQCRSNISIKLTAARSARLRLYLRAMMACPASLSRHFAAWTAHCNIRTELMDLLQDALLP